MMRSLWNAASGMISQQTNLDTISNNLANVNTTGYKTERNEFKSLLYQTLQKDSTNAEGEAKPVGVQVGLGVRSSAITSKFKQGPLLESEGSYDFAIEGEGFFQVQRSDGTIAYTRNGALKGSMGVDGVTLCTAEGELILDTAGQPIVLEIERDISKITFDEYGNLLYPDETGNAQLIGKQFGLVQFNNPAGLEKLSDSLLKESAASGTPRAEGEDTAIQRSKLHHGYLEGSNVQAVDEMVNLIIAQRAYEMNSKAITASDEMLQQANNLRN